MFFVYILYVHTEETVFNLPGPSPGDVFCVVVCAQWRIHNYDVCIYLSVRFLVRTLINSFSFKNASFMNVFAQRCVAFVFNIHLVTRHTRSYTHARADEMYGRERKYDVLYGIQEQEKKNYTLTHACTGVSCMRHAILFNYKTMMRGRRRRLVRLLLERNQRQHALKTKSTVTSESERER